MWEFYVWVREYLRAVRAGNPDKVRRLLRKHRSLLEEEETLLAPIYFQEPEVARVVMEEVFRLFGRRRFYHHGLYGLLHWFGEAGTKELERDVLRFLRHPRRNMREIALSVLTLHWKIDKHRRKYVELLTRDPDAQVRWTAASGLGLVLMASRDRQASRLMAHIMRDESEDFTVRRTAYEALRDVWIPWRRRRVESAGYYRNRLNDKVEDDLAAWKQWVDWDFVAHAEKGSVPLRIARATRSRYLGEPRRANSGGRVTRPARRRRR
ncbi:MAG: HEAT repeat domain-containing protein [Armatimonadetes bacterium]|nr:HEAT repeat domain-containing protein [Armatimonadota bacterium]